MTGFRSSLDVARCCCGCTDCCNGAWADEFDVTITLGYDSEASGPIDNSCTETECNDLGGTFTLQKVDEYNCTWNYLSGPINYGCQAPYETPIIRRDVWMNVLCLAGSNPEEYTVSIWMEVERQNPIPICTNLLPWVQRWHWRRRILVSEFSCVTAEDVAIPTTNGVDWYRPFTAGVCSPFPEFPLAQVSYLFDWLCDPRDDAIATAVP